MLDLVTCVNKYLYHFCLCHQFQIQCCAVVQLMLGMYIMDIVTLVMCFVSMTIVVSLIILPYVGTVKFISA